MTDKISHKFWGLGYHHFLRKIMRFKFYLFVIFMLAIVPIVEATQLKIMLRYDDYSHNSNTDVEQALFDGVKSVGGGVLVGVIPFPKSPYPIAGSYNTPLPVDLDEKKIGLLKTYASQGVVEIAVHGFSHKSNTLEKPNSEFTGLPENTQSLLLSSAKASLEAAVGLKINSFIPPFNQYDNQTLESLERNGYKLLSASLAGPKLRDGNLTYLPGGPYPQRLKGVVSTALSKGHTDAIIISTLHPYDIIETGEKMVDFRRGSPQISIHKLITNLHQIKQLNGVQFISFRELFESGEDLSADRMQANLKVRESFVTRHRLIPKTFNAYPLTGLYYSQESTSQMHQLQISIFVLLYGLLALAVIITTKTVIHHLRSRVKNITALIGVISVGGLLTFLIKSFLSGFYMTSAIGLICFSGVLAGIMLDQWLTTPK